MYQNQDILPTYMAAYYHFLPSADIALFNLFYHIYGLLERM